MSNINLPVVGTVSETTALLIAAGLILAAGWIYHRDKALVQRLEHDVPWLNPEGR